MCGGRGGAERRRLDRGGLQPGTPKSGAGKRTVAFPAEIAPEIRWHLDRFAEPGERGHVFVGPKGGKLRRSNFRVSVWSKACQAVGLPTLHFHDLRHTGGALYQLVPQPAQPSKS